MRLVVTLALALSALAVGSCSDAPMDPPPTPDATAPPLAADEGPNWSYLVSGNTITVTEDSVTVILTRLSSTEGTVEYQVHGVTEYFYEGPMAEELQPEGRFTDYKNFGTYATWRYDEVDDAFYLTDGGDTDTREQFGDPDTRTGGDYTDPDEPRDPTILDPYGAIGDGAIGDATISSTRAGGGRTRGATCCDTEVSRVQFAGAAGAATLASFGYCGFAAFTGPGVFACLGLGGLTTGMALYEWGRALESWRDCVDNERRARVEADARGETFTCPTRW